MLHKDLQTLGFTKNLSTIYLVLFELGEAKAGDIVRRTGMHRNIVYRGLEELEEKKLLTKTQIRGVARYKALDPTRLMGEVESKQRLAEQIIDELKTKHTVASQEIVMYEGKESIQKKYLALYATSKEGEEWYILGLSEEFFIVNGKSHVQKLIDFQKKNKFHIKGIGASISDQEHRYMEETGALTEFKFIPSISRKDTEIVILKDRVLIFIFTKPYTVVEIFNKDLVESYTEYFYFLWNQEVTTFSGWNQIAHLFNTLLIDELHPGDRECVIGGGYGSEDTAPQVSSLFLQHNKALIDKGVEKHGLFFEQHAAHYEEQIQTLGKYASEFVQTRYLPESYSSPVETHVFKHKVVISYFGKDPVSTVYERPEIVYAFQKQFELLWNQEVRTYTGWDQVENLFFDSILPTLGPEDTEKVIAAGYDKPIDTKRFRKFWIEYNTRGVKKGFKKQLIQFERFRSDMKEEMNISGDDGSYAQLRYLPDVYDRPMETYIYKEKAILVVWGDEPVATVYQRSDVIEGFRAHFELLWDIATE